MSIGEASSIEEFPQDSLIKPRSRKVVLSGMPDIDLGKGTKGRTVSNPGGNHRNPNPLATDKELPKATSQKRKRPNGILNNGMGPDLEPNRMQPLAKDFRQGIERGIVGTKRTMV